MFVAVLIRIDLALLAGLSIGWLYFSRKTFLEIPILVLVISAVGIVGLVIAEIVFAGNYGESLSVYYNSGMNQTQSFSNYFRKIFDLLPQLRYSSITLFAAIVVIAILAKKPSANWRKGFSMQLVALILSYVIIRCVIFPALEDRFFIAEYLLLAIASIKYFNEEKEVIN